MPPWDRYQSQDTAPAAEAPAAGPWAKYQTAAPAGAKPWEKFGGKPEPEQPGFLSRALGTAKRIGQAAVEGAKGAYDEPLALIPEDQAEQIGISHASPLGILNRTVGGDIDAVMRAPGALINAGSRAVGQAFREAGDETGAGQLERDLPLLGTSAIVAAGGGPEGAAKVGRPAVDAAITQDRIAEYDQGRAARTAGDQAATTAKQADTATLAKAARETVTPTTLTAEQLGPDIVGKVTVSRMRAGEPVVAPNEYKVSDLVRAGVPQDAIDRVTQQVKPATQALKTEPATGTQSPTGDVDAARQRLKGATLFNVDQETGGQARPGRADRLTPEIRNNVVSLLNKILPQRAKDDPFTSHWAFEPGNKDVPLSSWGEGAQGHVGGVTEGRGASTFVSIARDISERAADPEAKYSWIARHETLHALRSMGLFTKDEFRTLWDTAKKYWIKTVREDGAPVNIEEAIAEAYAGWGQEGARAIKGLPPSESTQVARIFQKIKNFYERVVNSTKGVHKEQWEKIFSQIESGEIGARDINTFKGDERPQGGGIRYHIDTDPKQFDDVVTVARDHIRRGARDFGAFSKAMKAEFGAAVEPHLQKIYDAAIKPAGRAGYFAPKSEPGPIAEEGPLSRGPALTQPREFENQLFQLQQNTVTDQLDTIKKLGAVPKGVEPAVWEKLYHHEENPDGVPLDPAERALYDQHVAPLKAEADQLYNELESLGHPEVARSISEEAPASKGYTPRYQSGRTRSYGEVLDQWRKGVEAKFGGAGGRSMRKTADAQKSRRFFKAVGPDGDETVVYVAPGGDVLPFRGDGQAGDKMGAFSGSREPGSKFMVGNQTWRLENATTKEIEDVAKVRYSKNVLANRLDNLAKLRSAVRNAKFVEGMKADPAFPQVAVKTSDVGVPPETNGRQWRVPKTLQFRNYYMDPRIADALDDFVGNQRDIDGLSNGLDKVGRVMNFVMFLNPKAHLDNVFNHMNVERGLVGNVIDAPSTMRNTVKAIREVSKVGPEYIRALKAGASLPYARMLTSDLHAKLVEKLGGDVRENPTAWQSLARAAGYKDLGTMASRLLRVPQAALWYGSDIMTLSRIMQLKEKGYTLEQAFKKTEEHMPNYRVPGQVAGSRALAQAFSNPAVGRFGRYQYGRLASYFRMLKDAFGADRSIGERADAFDKLAMLGVYTFMLYPMIDNAWQAVLGNPDAKTSRAGASGPPQAVLDVINGDKQIGDLPASLFTLGVPLEVPLELYHGRYNWNGQPIARDADVRAGRYDRVAKDVGGYAASKLSGIGQALDVNQGKMTGGQAILRNLGVSAPTPDQAAMKKKYKAIDERNAHRRDNRLNQKAAQP